MSLAPQNNRQKKNVSAVPCVAPEQEAGTVPLRIATEPHVSCFLLLG